MSNEKLNSSDIFDKFDVVSFQDLETGEATLIEGLCKELLQSDQSWFLSRSFGYDILRDVLSNMREDWYDLSMDNVEDIRNFLERFSKDFDIDFLINSTKVDLTLSITDFWNRGSKKLFD